MNTLRLILKWIGKNPILAAAGLLLVAVGLLFAQNASLKREIIRKDLALDTQEALIDTTRVRALGDSLLLAERRAVQLQVERDSLDKALDIETRVRIGIQVALNDLVVDTRAGVTETPEGVRESTFQGYQLPYAWDATVALPKPPGEGTMALRVSLDPIVLSGRVACGDAPDGRRVRPASVFIVSPTWADVTLSGLEQDPDVCNPNLFDTPRHTLRNLGVGVGVGLLISLIF